MPENQDSTKSPEEIHPESVPLGDESIEASTVTNADFLQQDWIRLQQEASEYKDKYLRLLAEMENARKRMQRERQELSQLAMERVIVDFLHPLDNFENALKFADQASDEVKHWALGFQMLLDQFKEVLAQHGVSVLPAQGKEFDPHLHEAIELVESSDYPPGTIIDECGKGYRMGSRTIRPSRVKVAKAPDNNIGELDTNNLENQ